MLFEKSNAQHSNLCYKALYIEKIADDTEWVNIILYILSLVKSGRYFSAIYQSARETCPLTQIPARSLLVGVSS